MPVNGQTKAQRRAVKRMEEVVEEASRTPEDPGLRGRFLGLPRAPIRIICCPLDKGINHGNVLRIAECFRLEEVCFSSLPFKKEQDFSGGAAALRWQPHRWVETVQAIKEAKETGCRVYGLTLTEGATPVQTVEWRHPAAILLGRELEGLDPEPQALCDELVSIPLYGLVQSLNVAVSAALAVESCFEAFRRKNPGFEPARRLFREMIKTKTPSAEG